MKENSVFFLLTNPRQRLDTGRRLAGVGTRLSKSQNNSSFGLNQAFIWGMSAEVVFRLVQSRVHVGRDCELQEFFRRDCQKLWERRKVIAEATAFSHA